MYQDLGNLNFSFILPGPDLERRKHAELLQRAFEKADMHLEISPRNDLWLNGKKISGSAYKQTKSACFHHGTFLISSDIFKLEEALKNTLVPRSSKSIPSVRSQVTTLQSTYPGVEISDVIELIAHFFQTIPLEIEGTLLSNPLVKETFDQLRSWEWLWGETPLFELTNGPWIKKGIIESSGEKFCADSMRHFLSESELQRLFPDFSEQHRLSSQIWGPSDQ